MVEASYSGAKGTHLYDIENINLAGAGQYYLGDPLVQGSPNAPTPALPIDHGGVDVPDPSQTSNIRTSTCAAVWAAAATMLLTSSSRHKTFIIRGLTLITNYTWSHSFDDLSTTFGSDTQGGSGYIGSLGYTDFTQPGLDWGSSDFNVGNRFVVSPIWETPWFKSGGSLLDREALGGWTISGSLPLAKALLSQYLT